MMKNRLDYMRIILIKGYFQFENILVMLDNLNMKKLL